MSIETPDQLVEWAKCARDVAYFLDGHARILDPKEGLIRFRLRDYQEEMLGTWQANRYTIILKARQIGITWLVAGYVLWLAMFHFGKTILLISRRGPDAKKLLARIRVIYDHLPASLKAATGDPDNTDTMTFPGMASKIESLPATADTGRSESASLVVMDEAAHGKFRENDEAIWTAIEPLAHQVIVISTANGFGNWFQRTYHAAVQRLNDFKAVFLGWFVDPTRDDAWYAHKVKNLTKWAVHQEYPRTPEEAFVQSGRPVFDQEALTAIALEDVREPVRVDENGALWVWTEPQPDHEYVIGCDVAEGLEHGDFSVAEVLDWETGEQVAELAGLWPPEVFAQKVFELACGYGGMIAPERNNHGHAVVLKLGELIWAAEAAWADAKQRARTDPTVVMPPLPPRLYTAEDERAGWVTNNVTKPVMIDGLEEAIRKREVTIRSTALVMECRSYAHLGNGKMGGDGMHDDRVMGQAIAWAVRGRVLRERDIRVW